MVTLSLLPGPELSRFYAAEQFVQAAPNSNTQQAPLRLPTSRRCRDHSPEDRGAEP